MGGDKKAGGVDEFVAPDAGTGLVHVPEGIPPLRYRSAGRAIDFRWWLAALMIGVLLWTAILR